MEAIPVIALVIGSMSFLLFFWFARSLFKLMERITRLEARRFDLSGPVEALHKQFEDDLKNARSAGRAAQEATFVQGKILGEFGKRIDALEGDFKKSYRPTRIDTGSHQRAKPKAG